MSQGVFYQEGRIIDFTPIAACAAGDVVKHTSGLAGICTTDIAAGILGSLQVSGVVTLAKKITCALLAGGDVYWDVSASVANFRADAGTPDFFIGTVAEDAAYTATTVKVRLNSRINYDIDYERGGDGEFVATMTGTTGVTLVLPGGQTKFNIANANEAQALTLAPIRGVPVSAKPIVEFRLRLVSATGANEDFEWGLIDVIPTTLATVESSNAFATFHNDADDLVIDTESDDGTTDRPIVTSGISHVAADFTEYWLDARDETNVRFYVNGVEADYNSLPRRLAAVLATVVYPFFMVAKLASADVAEARLSRMRLRCQTE